VEGDYMKNINLTLDYWKDGNWYVGQLVEIPGVMSQGATLAELESNIDDAYRLLLAERIRPLEYR
jgi:predicted RNase H-like HicB family nuclease